VIRTSSDVGIVALMDERFLTPGYLKLFPREWQNFSSVSTEEIGGRVSRFWDSWL
jgi:Rad3-related DNA helicase